MATVLIDPGALRQLLVLERCETSQDESGGLVEVWTEVAQLFALVEPLAAGSRFGADQTLETVTHRITLRWREGLASGMRFVKQGRRFEIVTVHDPDETGRYLVCRVEETGA